MASVIPVRLVMKCGIFCSGFTKEVNSSIILFPSKLKIDISVIFLTFRAVSSGFYINY